ncbi:transthyretin-like family domain-containing protein [Ditylenchus destructor]|nr:transthyretin-like family domain-containing protein [Ditylenchus destructor]
MSILVLFLVAISISISPVDSGIISDKRGTWISGKIRCGSKFPQGQVTVELWEHDSFSPDDRIEARAVDSDYRYEIKGIEEELTSIKGVEFYLRFVHTCQPFGRDVGPVEKIDSIYQIPFEMTWGLDEPEDFWPFDVDLAIPTGKC